MKRQIRCIEMQPGETLTAPLPKGVYAQVSYNGEPTTVNRLRAPLQRTFPWVVQIFSFSDGLCDAIGSGSRIGEVLVRHQVKKIYLVGADEERRKELEAKLAEQSLELVA